MGVVTQESPDPLLGGFYTVREAARLLNIEQPRRIYAWLSGHYRSGAGPIIDRQYQPLGNAQEVGFLDLMEIRFVDHFRRQRISLQALRKAAVNARKELQQQHPFATYNVKFQTDRKQIFLEVAKETGDKFLFNLMTKQVEIYEAIEQVLAQDVAFDPYSGIARQWHPSKAHPSVLVDPRIAYGRPALHPDGVPTAAIFNLWRAERANYEVVADWFDVPIERVREAVDYQIRLAA